MSPFFRSLVSSPDRLTTPLTPPTPPTSNSDHDGKTVYAVLNFTLATLTDLADAVPIPGLKVALGSLLLIVSTAEAKRRNVDDLRALDAQLMRLKDAIIEPLIGTRTEDLSDTLRKRIEKLCSDLGDTVTNKKKIASRSSFGSFWFASDDAITIVDLHEKINDALSQFLLEGMITQELLLAHKMKKEEDRSSSELINSLPRAEAAWNSRQRNSATGCLKGTREALLDTIYGWIKDIDPSKPRIFWLNGLAGTGKSSVAHTVAEYCHQNRLLGASFFFSRDQADRSDPRLVFSTIAHQLSTFHRSFKHLISHALEADIDLGRVNAGTQLQKLIIEPLQKAKDVSSPVIVVMDALDECSPERDVSELLKLLAAGIPKLPVQFKFFITSRPERHISRQFESMAVHPISSSFILHEIESSLVRSDIELFLHRRLGDIAIVRGYSSWPLQSEVQALADKAGNLFIFASTAVKYIEDNGKHQLRVLLHIKGWASLSPDQISFRELDALYSQVLRTAIRGSLGRSLCSNFSDFQAVVGAIVLLLDPLSSKRLAILLDVDIDSITDALWGLESVIMIPKSGDQVIRVIHPSFHDFLTNQSRCPDPVLFVNPFEHHGRLAVCCLNRMVSCLRQDICKIGDSSKLNAEVLDLTARLEDQVSPDLQYSCLHWASHLSFAPSNATPVESLTSFCFKHLLHWLEVLSLLGRLDVAVPSLRYARKWSMGVKGAKLVELLSDAERFVLEFFEPITASAQQVYYSALPFTPTATLLAKTYADHTQPVVKVLSGVQKVWDPCLRVLEGHSDSVNAVTFSPDGSRIASASLDKTLRIWDATTGAFITSLVGHTKIVNAVAVSPDRSRIVSGSHDKTLRFWDAITSTTVAIARHSSSVTTIAISPDGDRTVSGSEDGMLQLYNSITGILIASLKGHSDRVTTVAFSPSDSHIASGSNDSTLRLWDAKTGDLHASFEGHFDRVNCVAFSPVGNRVVSGSDDSTLQLWDVVTGSIIKSLEGHSFRVTTVAFSPGGDRIASGSADGSLRFWEGTTGAFITSIRGHAHIITSIAFSPDGNRLVSGSYDSSVRLWDLRTWSTLAYLMGHSSIVTAVMYSPDGSRVISGSIDNTLRLWDVTTGISTTVIDGHSDHVMTLAFSPSGRRIFSGSVDCTLQLWDSTTGASIASLDGHSDIVKAAAFSPVGSCVVSGSDDGSVKMWDAKTGALITSFEGHSDRVTTIAFSPDGSRVVSGCVDNTLQLWDTTTNLKTAITSLAGHSDYIVATSFSPDGSYIISGSYDCTLRLWDALTGAFLVSFRGHTKVITTATFSPGSHRVASGSDDATVRIWDTTTGTNIMTLCGHSYRTAVVAFSPSGDYVVSGSDDNTLRLWDAKTGVSIASLTFSPPLLSDLEFASDGKSIIINDQSQLRFWAALPTAGAVPFASDGKLHQSTEVVRQTVRNQWLMEETRSGCRRICWVPLDSRGSHQISHASTCIIGGDQGRITILDCSAFR